MVKAIKVSDNAHKLLTSLRDMDGAADKTYAEVIDTLLKENLVTKGLYGMIYDHKEKAITGERPVSGSAEKLYLEGGYKQVAKEIGVDEKILYKDMVTNPSNYPFILLVGKRKKVRVITKRYEYWLDKGNFQIIGG